MRRMRHYLRVYSGVSFLGNYWLFKKKRATVVEECLCSFHRVAWAEALNDGYDLVDS